MLSNSKEKGSEGKQEGISDEKYTFPKAPTSSRQWSGFRNPRIVRVSRSFGGKDRHSKVCTIRGLRDRRIRLSVPTAIQLYDLQEKLRLGQPSKVIDWLLDVTKLDIDKLPPLQIPNGFSQFHQQMLFPQYNSSSSQFSFPPFVDTKESTHIKDVANQTTMEKSKFWDSDLAAMRAKSNQTSCEKGKWIDDATSNHQVEDYNDQLSAQKLFSLANRSSLPNMMNNATAYNYNSSDQPSCLSLSQFGNNGVFPPQADAQTSSSSGSALFFCPPSNSSAAALFTPYASYIANPFESHIHFLSSNSHALPNPFVPAALQPFGSQNMKPFPANFNLKQLLHADNNGGSSKDGAASNS